MHDPELGDLRVHADTDKRRKARAKKFYDDDPFKSVPCGLLSSSEIEDYIRVTGMLEECDDKHLKSASYEVFAEGEFIYWEGDKRKRKIVKKGQQSLTLPANSITFIQARNYFMLPSYIAMRFNLRIAHVHRGLLLGTGPLVDPGFRGRLLIPLHNLTSSEYHLDLTEALIWVEFTKTTANFNGFNDAERLNLRDDRRWKAKPFPIEKSDKAPEYYLFRASNGQPIQSSIPEAIDSASEDAKSARESVEGLQNWARGIGVLTILGAVVGVAGIVTATWSNIRTVDKDIANALSQVQDVKKLAEANKREIAPLDKMSDRVAALELAQKQASTQPPAADAGALAEANRRIDVLEATLAGLRTRLDEVAAKTTVRAAPASQPAVAPRSASPRRRRPPRNGRAR